jgi:hypothetical protein
MRAHLARLFAAAVLALAIAGARAVDLPPGKRKTAEDLYNVKCAKCHKFYDPAAYSEKDWEMWMRKMSRKAKLKPEQDELLRRYLGEFRTKTK